MPTFNCVLKVNGRFRWSHHNVSSCFTDADPTEALAIAVKHANELADVYAEQYPNQHVRVEVTDGKKRKPHYVAKRNHQEA